MVGGYVVIARKRQTCCFHRYPVKRNIIFIIFLLIEDLTKQVYANRRKIDIIGLKEST